MKLAKVEETAPGQKVAKDVTDLKGVLLFKAGTELTDQIIQRIRARNVTHIFIEEEGGGAAGGRFRSPEDVDKELDRVFSHVQDNEVMMRLRDAAKEYLKTRLS